MIELRNYDLFIKTIKDKESGEDKKVVQIKGALAFDEGFIEECAAKGVKEWVIVDEETGDLERGDIK